MTERSDTRPASSRRAPLPIMTLLAATFALAAAGMPARAQDAPDAKAESAEAQEKDTTAAQEKEKQEKEKAESKDSNGISVHPTISDHPTIRLRFDHDDAFVAALRRPIDIELREATVRQMAETMSKSTGLRIVVDAAVPETTRLSLEAHHVPLVTVLDAVGRQANLLIAPEPDDDKGVTGILLTRPAMLKVNGREQFVSATPTFPWSSEWGIPPTAEALSSTYTFGSLAKLAQDQNVLAGRQGETLLSPVPLSELSGVVPGPPAPGPLTMTAVGSDLLAVAETGVSEKGEAGAWLTLYRLQKDGKGMTRLGSTFHAYHARSMPVTGPGTLPPGGPTPAAGLPTPLPEEGAAKPAPNP
jgi:hypothetical protein